MLNDKSTADNQNEDKPKLRDQAWSKVSWLTLI